MRLFFTVTKRGLGIALGVAVMVFAVLSVSASLKASAIDGSTHRSRMVYIKGLNINVDEEGATLKETVIPQVFNDVYSEYNRLQLKAGFDLSRYKGEMVTIYTYPVIGKEQNLNLIVLKGEIIGGDICDIAADGEMISLG